MLSRVPRLSEAVGTCPAADWDVSAGPIGLRADPIERRDGFNVNNIRHSLPSQARFIGTSPFSLLIKEPTHALY